MQQRKFTKNEITPSCASDGEMPITDLLGKLFGELSTMFYSISKVTRTVLGLKEQLMRAKPMEEVEAYNETEDTIEEEENDE